MKPRGLRTTLISSALLLSICAPLPALELPDIQLYRSPKPLPMESSDQSLTCRALDREIARLSPYTNNYRPDFDKDPYSGAAILVGTTMFWPAYIFHGFKYAGDFQEEKRIHKAAHRIESLRRLKQEKFCYEDRG